MFQLKFEDRDYPQSLRSIHEPPKILWGEGDSSLLHEGTRVALVGSREATSYGRSTALRLGRELAERGMIVVSGLAVGIDAAAHEGALRAGGKTLAVLGCGMDIPYPKENLDLKRRIGERGLLLTEFSDGEEPAPWTFPRRNRIISGLSSAVVVVEAGEKSGALVTANWALEQGREVLAVPGNIDSAKSVGANRLIQNGATPVLSVDDILGTLKLPVAARVENRDPVMRALEDGRRSIDEIASSSGLAAAEVSARLVAMEIEGLVRALPGGVFEKVYG